MNVGFVDCGTLARLSAKELARLCLVEDIAIKLNTNGAIWRNLRFQKTGVLL
jgi:hypothetical protein